MKKRNLSKFTRRVLISFVSVMTVSLLMVLSQLQLKYVKDYEIPPLISCAYYDDFDNLIYTSQYQYICPELENLEYKQKDGKRVLTFSVTEHPEGTTNWPLSIENGITVGSESYMEHIRESEFEYVYYFKGRLEQITITSRVEMIKDGEPFHYGGLKKVIKNTYAKNLVTSTYTTYSYNQGVEAETTFNLPVFADLEPIKKVYFSEITQNQNEKLVENLIDITEKTTVEGEEVLDVFAKGTMAPGHTIELHGYKNNRYNKNSVIFDFSYDELKIKREAPSSYMGDDREGTFVYKGSQFGYPDNYILSSYTRMVVNREQGKEVNIKHYEVDSDLYAVNNLSTSKILMTDYGKKVEYYYTNKSVNGRYPEPRNNGGTFKVVFSNPYVISLGEMYDYRRMLFDFTNSERIDYYQFNPLIEGFELMHDEMDDVKEDNKVK